MKKCENINRLRVILAEKGISNHWLAEKLGKTDMTVSRWCTNRAQPSLGQLVEIAEILEIDVKDLLESSLKEKQA